MNLKRSKSHFIGGSAIMLLVGILVYATHYSPGLLEIRDVIEPVIIVGMFTFGASRFYYIRRGVS